MKKEFRVTMNILRTVISGDVYEVLVRFFRFLDDVSVVYSLLNGILHPFLFKGIRAVTIDKDNAPKASLSLSCPFHTKLSPSSFVL